MKFRNLRVEMRDRVVFEGQRVAYFLDVPERTIYVETGLPWDRLVEMVHEVEYELTKITLLGGPAYSAGP